MLPTTGILTVLCGSMSEICCVTVTSLLTSLSLSLPLLQSSTGNRALQVLSYACILSLRISIQTKLTPLSLLFFSYPTSRLLEKEPRGGNNSWSIQCIHFFRVPTSPLQTRCAGESKGGRDLGARCSWYCTCPWAARPCHSHVTRGPFIITMVLPNRSNTKLLPLTGNRQHRKYAPCGRQFVITYRKHSKYFLLAL